MGDDDAADQDGRQPERTTGAMPGQIEHERHGAGGRQFGHGQTDLRIDPGSELEAVAGDDANGAQKNQKAGGAEKSADHRVRHIADRAAHPRHPKPQSTMPVTMLERPSVIKTGASSGPVGSAASIRSTSDDANIPVVAMVELSGPADRKRQGAAERDDGGENGR